MVNTGDQAATTPAGRPSVVSAGFSELLDTEIGRRDECSPASNDEPDVLSAKGSGNDVLEASLASETQDVQYKSNKEAARTQEWPFFETPVDFSLPTEIVKQRAAWAWYRTALICVQAAKGLKQRGKEQIPRDLGLDLLAADS